MWISEYVTANSFKPNIAGKGSVTSCSGEKSSVSASSEHFSVRALAPAGVSYIPAVGDESVVISTASGDFQIGVVGDTSGLEPGELKLCSSGGASITLKNDGRVLINGREIS